MSLKKVFFSILAIMLLLAIFNFGRPLPTIQATTVILQPKTTEAVTLPWPAYGQGALSAQDYGVLQIHEEQKAVPIASITKVVTALAVLKQKPLSQGQQGPNITISSDDVAIYNSYYSQGGSVVKVEIGEQISEYQALQALLIPSANNIADTLARWAFGSMDNFISHANKMVADMSLNSTKVADASGISSNSVSSAQDLVKLGLAVMRNSVITSIVSQQKTELPVVGAVSNVNWLLGDDGVIGIKTGNTDQAGGCFLFAAKRVIGGQNITLVGAVMQAPDLNTAIADSRALIRASDSNFESVIVASKDQVVGTYKTPWGVSVEAIASQDLSILAWRGSHLQVLVKLNKIKSSTKGGTVVGSLSVISSQKTVSVPVILKSNLTGPSWSWRIFR